jgi:DNA-binding response OmpR family regulator
MSRSHAVLIVDTDPKGLESLVYGFQGADWRITACPVPETASMLVRASGAEIVVIALRGDDEKVHALVRQLGSKDAHRALPILVLGPENCRAQFKANGAVDLLPLPAYVRDVLTASRLLIATAAAATSQTDDPRYQGPSGPVETLSLIRTLNGLGRSGLLHIEQAGRHGEIWFHQGELTAAQFGQLQGTSAVQHLLLWDSCTVDLRFRPVARRGQIHHTTQEFLEEIDRFQRDFIHAIKNIGPVTTVYTRDEDRLAQSTGDVPAEVTPVVRLCDGVHTLSDVVDDSPFRVLDTVRILERLCELGILLRREPQPARAVAMSRTPLQEFWETAFIEGPPASLSRAPGRMGTTPVPVDRVHSDQPTTSGYSAPDVTNLDRRDKAETRREGERRGRKPTLDLGTTGAAAPSASGTVEAVAVETAVSKSGGFGAGTQASGTFELRKGDRRSKPAMQPSFSIRVSEALTTPVVSPPDDKPSRLPTPATPAILAAPAALAAAPAALAAAANTPAATLAPIPLASLPKQATLPGLVPENVKPAEAITTRITGILSITPSGKTARPASPASRSSIQLDASLISETAKDSAAGARMVDENKPLAKTEAANNNIKPETSGGIVTGILQVSPSGKSNRSIPTMERKSASFQIDPSLTLEAPAVVARSTTPATGAPEETIAASASGPNPHGPHKQSGGFSAMESDFFEREADLYREEHPESFADLDDDRAKALGRTGTDAKARKKNGKIGK